jgi:hypothetical protein
VSAPTTGDPLSLSVSGTARLVAAFDVDELTSSLAGVSEKDITAVRAQFPAFKSLNVKIYPFWRRGAIPENIEKINIEVLLGLDVSE